ncbi:hypothetical protein KCU99_g416, partial [Aureobasidium melanogenum]
LVSANLMSRIARRLLQKGLSRERAPISGTCGRVCLCVLSSHSHRIVLGAVARRSLQATAGRDIHGGTRTLEWCAWACLRVLCHGEILDPMAVQAASHSLQLLDLEQCPARHQYRLLGTSLAQRQRCAECEIPGYVTSQEGLLLKAVGARGHVLRSSLWRSVFVGAMSFVRVIFVAEDRRPCLSAGSGRVGKPTVVVPSYVAVFFAQAQSHTLIREGPGQMSRLNKAPPLLLLHHIEWLRCNRLEEYDLSSVPTCCQHLPSVLSSITHFLSSNRLKLSLCLPSTRIEMSPNTKKTSASQALTFVVNVLESMEGGDALAGDLLTGSDLRRRVVARTRLLLHLKSALHEQLYVLSGGTAISNHTWISLRTGMSAYFSLCPPECIAAWGLGATVGSLTYPALDCWRVVALAEDDMDSSSESSMMSCCDPAWTDERERELPDLRILLPESLEETRLAGVSRLIDSDSDRVARGDENFVKLAEKDCLSSSTCGSEVSMRSDDRDTSCCWSSVVVVGTRVCSDELVEAIRRSRAGRQPYGRLADSKLLTTRLVDRRRDGCGWPMGDGCDRDEPAEQIRGSVVVKAWLNGLCKGQAESNCYVGSLVNVAYARRGSHARGRGSGRRGQMQIGSGAEERCLSVVGY